jgi:hypothetical protein
MDCGDALAWRRKGADIMCWVSILDGSNAAVFGHLFTLSSFNYVFSKAKSSEPSTCGERGRSVLPSG